SPLFFLCSLWSLWCIFLLGRAVAVDVLDGRGVAPGDAVARQAEDGGDLIALGRGGRPTAEHDCKHPPLIEPCLLGPLRRRELVLGAEVRDILEGFHGCPPSRGAGHRHGRARATTG